MRQLERRERSRALILEAAICEFARSGYKAATMEDICSRHGISKGMMYHYYSGKDDLYIASVAKIADGLYGYLTTHQEDCSQRAFQGIADFYKLRETYFQDKVDERKVFEEAVLSPPEALEAEVDKVRAPIKALNRSRIRSVLSTLELRPGVSDDMAERYLSSLSTSFKTLLASYTGDEVDMHKVLTGVEELLSLLIFGLAGPASGEGDIHGD